MVKEKSFNILYRRKVIRGYYSAIKKKLLNIPGKNIYPKISAIKI